MNIRKLIHRAIAVISYFFNPPMHWTPAAKMVPSTARSTEIAAAGLFLLIFFLPPVFVTDLYPLTRTPMFFDAPQQLCLYELTDPKGSPLPPQVFGLHYTYDGNPANIGFGYKKPPSISPAIDRVQSQDEVVTWVQPRLLSFPKLEFVNITQKVIGRLDGHVGIIRTNSWRVDNPTYAR